MELPADLVKESDEMVILSVPLSRNRLWNCTVLTGRDDCKHVSVSNVVELSKYVYIS